MIEFRRIGNRTGVLFRDGGSWRVLRSRLTPQHFADFAPRIWQFFKEQKSRVAYLLIPNHVRHRDPFPVGGHPAWNQGATVFN